MGCREWSERVRDGKRERKKEGEKEGRKEGEEWKRRVKIEQDKNTQRMGLGEE